MRRPLTLALCAGLSLTAACQRLADAEVARAIDAATVMDEANLHDIMLNARDPEEAVAHFRQGLDAKPDDVDMMRALARSLVRAGRPGEAAPIWRAAAAHPGGTDDDLVELAATLIRTGDWTGARTALGRVPPTVETYARYRLEAMVADSEQRWDDADHYYETAAALTSDPSSVLNNWGYSKLTRGDHGGAETLFARAVAGNPDLFTAKNNLVLARGAQRVYELPLIPMSQAERAQLLHSAALAAVKQGDVSTAKVLLREAIDTHPQHFDAAATALATLEQGA